MIKKHKKYQTLKQNKKKKEKIIYKKQRVLNKYQKDIKMKVKA